jgi:hypothetical protein
VGPPLNEQKATPYECDENEKRMVRSYMNVPVEYQANIRTKSVVVYHAFFVYGGEVCN